MELWTLFVVEDYNMCFLKFLFNNKNDKQDDSEEFSIDELILLDEIDEDFEDDFD